MAGGSDVLYHEFPFNGGTVRLKIYADGRDTLHYDVDGGSVHESVIMSLGKSALHECPDKVIYYAKTDFITKHTTAPVGLDNP